VFIRLQTTSVSSDLKALYKSVIIIIITFLMKAVNSSYSVLVPDAQPF